MGSTGSRTDWIFGIAALTTGVGVITMALFPLAIPLVALTAAAVLPLALPLIAIATIAAVGTGAWLGVRAAGRGVVRLAARGRRGSAPRAAGGRRAREALHGC